MSYARRLMPAVLLALVALLLGGCVNTNKDVSTLNAWLRQQRFGTAGTASPYSTDELGVDPEIRATITLAHPLTPDELRTIARDLETVHSRQPLIVTVRAGESGVDLGNAAAASDDAIAGFAAVAGAPGASAVTVGVLRDDRTLRVTTSRAQLTAAVRGAWAAGLRERADRRWQTTFTGGDSTVFLSQPVGDVDSATRLVDALSGTPRVDLKLDVAQRTLETKAAGRDELLADVAALRTHAAADVTASISAGTVFVHAPRSDADVATAWQLSQVDGVHAVHVMSDDVQAYGPRTAWGELERLAAALPSATLSTWGAGNGGACAIRGAGTELPALDAANGWCGEASLYSATVRPGQHYEFSPLNDTVAPDAVQAAIRAHPWTGDATIRLVCQSAVLEFVATSDGHARNATVSAASGNGATPNARDAQRARDILAAWDAHATR